MDQGGMMAEPKPVEVVRGHLVVSVAEASGMSKQAGGPPLWDPTFTEGFVKVEVRGGPRNVKTQTKLRTINKNTLKMGEELKLDVLEGANELRLMLCKEKRSQGRIGSSVVAACGIFVNDIIDAVPIDKYFELFKPKGGGDGGFIRISMDFVPAVTEEAATEEAKANEDHRLMVHSLTLSKEIREGNVELPKSSSGLPWKKIVLGLVAAAVAAGAAVVLQQKKDKKEGDKPSEEA